MPSYSLTKQLLATDEEGYKKATQSEFLKLAANGQLSKDILGRWLANDRLYIHSYCRGLGSLLSFLQYPDNVRRGQEPGAAKSYSLLMSPLCVWVEFCHFYPQNQNVLS